MRLRTAMEQEGYFLFRYRSYFPLVFFFLAAIVAYTTDYASHPVSCTKTYHWTSVGLVIVGMAIRFYTVGTSPLGTSGRNTDEQVADKLNTSGIYSLVRHPLYLGNYLVWLGLVFFLESLPFIFIFTLIYWLYYERIMMAEEAYIAEKFGVSFDEWSSKVPAFIPRLRGYTPPAVSFSVLPGLRGEYSGFISIVASYLFMETLIGWVRFGVFSIGDRMLYGGAVVVAISLILRTLKHYTVALNRRFTD